MFPLGRLAAATAFCAVLFPTSLRASNPSTAPVDQLIPWLLDEESQLRGIPFSGVIMDATGKHVLPFDPKNETDQRVLKQITAALDKALKRTPFISSQKRALTKFTTMQFISSPESNTKRQVRPCIQQAQGKRHRAIEASFGNLRDGS